MKTTLFLVLVIFTASFMTLSAQEVIITQFENQKITMTKGQNNFMTFKNNGREIVEAKNQYLYGYSARQDANTIIVMNAAGKFGLIDITGKILIPCEYVWLSNAPKNAITCQKNADEKAVPYFLPTLINEGKLEVAQMAELTAESMEEEILWKRALAGESVTDFKILQYKAALKMAEQAIAAAEANAKINARVAELKAKRGLNFIEIHGKKVEGDRMEFYFDNIFYNYLCVGVVVDGKQHVVSISTATGEAKILTNVHVVDKKGYLNVTPYSTANRTVNNPRVITKPDIRDLYHLKNITKEIIVLRIDLGIGAAGLGHYGFNVNNGTLTYLGE